MSFSCGCDWGPEWHRSSLVKARKHHRCCECGEVIPPGAVYEYAVGLWEGDVSSYHTCETCADLRASYDERGYCWTYGTLWADHIDELTNSGRPVPEHVIETARRKARGAMD